jgi:hypothetical protein
LAVRWLVDHQEEATGKALARKWQKKKETAQAQE